MTYIYADKDTYTHKIKLKGNTIIFITKIYTKWLRNSKGYFYKSCAIKITIVFSWQSI